MIHRRGKNLAVLVPVEDFALLEALEDRVDLEAAREALRTAEKDGVRPIAWEKLKEKLGL